MREHRGIREAASSARGRFPLEGRSNSPFYRRLQRGPGRRQGPPPSVGELNMQPKLALGPSPAGQDLQLPFVERVAATADSQRLGSGILEWGSLTTPCGPCSSAAITAPITR